ncbi:nicotinamide-nucleotide amidohydrolase family protein [Agriterribacter sp.]|uniref:CinA family protein n=1 Tax=Agriterribacter sp. TaxID=2821509 RepID=UPI002BF08916|nr:nicotinamide-nucleotide amidohydrolase family protein [Agriterribacter sp.]HRP56344.1 nicotinamide-nucleotide amidohydrolase family protein [Agriterribacter sp.]
MNLFPGVYLDEIGRMLCKRSETIAVGESVTSGLMQLAFSSAEGSIGFYQGGITAYNIAQKYRHLNVEPIHALACNCVSAKVAAEMALHVCPLFGSSWGIGITGYATPVPESNNEVFAYFAIAFKGEIKKAEKLSPQKDETFNLQLFYCKEVLKTLMEIIGAKM